MKNIELPRYIAHRGLHDVKKGIPENSLAAFSAAVEKGFAAELDVRFTADRKMVVFHDASTGRLCGENLDISSLGRAELSSLRLSGTDEKIPLLSEVLKLVSGKVFLLIELKESPHVPDAEKRLVHMLKTYKGEFAVQSFNPLSLMRIRKLAPDIMRGQLVSTYDGEKRFLRVLASKKAAWRSLSRPDFLSWDLRCISLDAVFAAADEGIQFVTWTASGEELLKTAEDFSSAVIFENVSENYFVDRS